MANKTRLVPEEACHYQSSNSPLSPILSVSRSQFSILRI